MICTQVNHLYFDPTDINADEVKWLLNQFDGHWCKRAWVHCILSQGVEQGEFEEAERYFERALGMFRQLHGGDEHPDVAAAINDLALSMKDRHELVRAQPHLARQHVHLARRAARVGPPPSL